MIDLHCHLLPGVDDGPGTLAEAVALARMAVRNGITHAVLTPHIIPGRYDNTPASLSAAYADFIRELAGNGIALRTALAAEIRIDPIIISMVEEETLPFLGDNGGLPLLLLEFPYTSMPPGALELVQWLVQRKIRVVLAHPERQRAIMENINRLEPYLREGCLVQITAASLSGVFGDAPKKTAGKLLERGWVSVMASDAHNNGLRAPELESGRRAAESIIGVEASWALVRELPRQITTRHFHEFR